MRNIPSFISTTVYNGCIGGKMVSIETCKRIGCQRLVGVITDEGNKTNKVVCWNKYCSFGKHRLQCCYECTYLGKNRPNKRNPNQCCIEDKDLYFRFIFAYRKEKRNAQSNKNRI